MPTAAALLSLLLAICAIPNTAVAQESTDDHAPELWAQVEGNVALVNDIPGRNMLPNEFGYGSRLGYRWDRWGVFGQITHNLWAPNREGWTIKPGVLNVGAGAEYLLFDRRVRISAAGGTSTLMFETVLDEAGTTGFFFEIRPAGLRWEVADSLRVEWDPVIFSLSQPVTEEPTLDQAEFKSVLAVEVVL